jgi:hypothetical protein
MGRFKLAKRYRPRPAKARAARKLPYKPRPTLLSRGEAAFFFALRAAVRGRYLIAFKVRLADLITCGESAWKEGFGHMIARHHLDFVICDFQTTDIRLAVELDDRSHDRPARKKRDAFVNEALAAAGIPLLRIQAAASYDPSSLAEAVESHLSAQK